MDINVCDPPNAAYADTTGEAILVDVTIDGHPGVYRFVACSYDSERHGVAIFNAAKAGEYGSISAYVPPSIEKNSQ